MTSKSFYGPSYVAFIGSWGEPERAPHIRGICESRLSVCLSVYLSVRMFDDLQMLF